MTEPDYYTAEGDGAVGTIHTVEQARAAHHLASADPDRDGTLTGPEHDAKYALERAAGSRADWANAHAGDADAGRDAGSLQTADAPAAPEVTAAPVVEPVVEAPAPVPAA